MKLDTAMWFAVIKFETNELYYFLAVAIYLV